MELFASYDRDKERKRKSKLISILQKHLPILLNLKSVKSSGSDQA